MTGGVRVGTSGWSYDHWKDVLYPPGTPVGRRLEHYVHEFDTVELNASFYRWPKDSTFAGWQQRLPHGFTMSVKAHRGLTHFRRLRDPEAWVERFERCWSALGDRREALLAQLHPDLTRDDRLLDEFLTLVPDWIPVAVEFRHPSWDDDAVYRILERHNASYVVMSGAHLPCVLRATSRLVYVRMHGPDRQNLYAGSYSQQDLQWWAQRIDEWRGQGHDVLVYFNNDGEGNAVHNARSLKALLENVAPRRSRVTG
ncbi:DUF72 domain-containing protein [Mycolicibacterium confluentis]|nr:DUF72 domain-containing protein [Mycolicibacterium confluentis]MCV7321698.1 DUF72 domain-containing protein [Mycolicibacterium confluentis]ORV31980.1 sensor histidine kinase [Mycolicibacterium confluentis]